MNTLSIIFLTIFTSKVNGAFAFGPIVETATGLIQGTIETSFFSKEFFSFRGIPYAEPPIGEFRFKVSYFGGSDKKS